jgi:hypothetical protein
MPGAVQPDEQLEWERRAGRPAGAAAIAGAVLLILGGILSARSAEKHAIDTYLRVDKDPSLITVPSIVQALGYVGVAFALFYLARATAARRQEMARPMTIMAVLGPLATGIALVVLSFAIVDVAHHIGDIPKPTGTKAQDDALKDAQTGSSFYATTSYVTLAARLALGFAFVLVALNAMRAGLLSRFLGVLGIIIGVLSVLFGGAGFILAFWLGAMAAIFLDRWPGEGRGPAWSVVEPIPWPSAMDRQREAIEARQAEEGGVVDGHAEEPDDLEDEPVGALDAEEFEDDEAGATAQPHATSKKRKKKRRG